MKALRDFHSYRPINHPLCPSAQQGFVVGTRGVTAIETDDDGVIVSLIPGDGSEKTKNNPGVRLLINAHGAGQILDDWGKVPAAVPKGKR